MKVLITGAAKRIGAAVARYLAERGHEMIIHYHHSEAEAKALLASLPRPESHRLIQMDLTVADAPSRLFDALGGSLLPEALINNASVYDRISLEEATPEAMQRILGINFLIPFELMRCFRHRVRRGQIINMLDHRIDEPDPVSGPYALAKKALRDATLACALDWAPDIRVNAVAPAFVLPPDGVPLERMERLVQSSPLKVRPTPQSLAAAVDFLMNSPAMTGQILYEDGGLHLMSPLAAAQEKKKGVC